MAVLTMTIQKSFLSTGTLNPDSFNLLNQEQLSQLDTLLEQLNLEEETNVYFVLGYVTGLGLLGKPLQPQVWLEDLFTQPEQLEVAQNADLAAILALLEVAAKQAQQGFAQDLSPNPPAELTFADNAEELADWCSGFMLAIFNNELGDKLDNELSKDLSASEASSCELVTSKLVTKKQKASASEPVSKDKPAKNQPKPLSDKQKEAMPELLFPIMALSGLFDEEEEFIEISADEELLEEFSEDLGEVLLDLYCLIHAPEEK